MSRQYKRQVAALLAGLLAVFSSLAQEPKPSPAPETPPVAQPHPVDQWLDEVRAQRQIREERRRAAKEAMDARRRWIDPWGAAQKEAREKETRRRHNALIEHIERDRELFRNWIPWGFHRDPWQSAPSGFPADIPLSTGTDAPDVAGNAEPPASSYPLPGWDNRWYYRGF